MNGYFFVNILQVIKNKFVNYDNLGGLIIPNNFYCCRSCPIDMQIFID